MKNSAIQSYLANNFIHPIRDPLWNHVHFSEGYLKLVSSGPFQRLANIKQLGPSYLVYPGATHTRLAHSIGVFHISKMLISEIVHRNGEESFSLEGIKAFLAAALLHDIGHFPYTHSLKELPLKEHEQLTAELILAPPIKTIMKEHLKVSPELCASIVDDSTPSGSQEIDIYRNLLSGVLDPDKLDYLTRDAYYCGVPYGIQDIDYAVSMIRLDNNKPAILEQGLSAAENILFSKYLMYKAVYWHKTVRIATAMIKLALFSAIIDGKINPDSLYFKTDYEFTQMCSSIDHPLMFLVEDVEKRKLYKSATTASFDLTNSKHIRLENLKYRREIEKAISKELKTPNPVIIDIPEKISFEMEIPVINSEKTQSYLESPTVFTSPVIHSFTSTLRKIRVLVSSEDFEKKHCREKVQEYI